MPVVAWHSGIAACYAAMPRWVVTAASAASDLPVASKQRDGLTEPVSHRSTDSARLSGIVGTKMWDPMVSGQRIHCRLFHQVKVGHSLVA